MMNKKLVVLSMLGALVAGSSQATEMRSPWLLAQGPIRYTFEKLHDKKYNLSMWSAMHAKEAHKSFLKHSFDTHEMTSLIFNKADFVLAEIFPDAKMPTDVQNYNPFVKLAKMNPRASYTEYGFDMGGRWDYPIWKDKGRIGLRATVPFRWIEIEREDITDKNADPVKDYVKSKVIMIDHKKDGSVDGSTKADVVCTAYRLDFVNLLVGSDHKQAIKLDTTNKKVVVFNKELQVAATDKVKDSNLAARVTLSSTPFPAKVYDKDFINEPVFYAWQTDNTADTGIGSNVDLSYIDIKKDYSKADKLVAIDANFNTPGLTSDSVGYFDNGVGYDLDFDKADDAKKAAALWMTFRRSSDSGNELRFHENANSISASIDNNITKLIEMYRENPYAYMSKRGFEFESQRRAGLGDVDVDLFYEHTFNADWMGELCLGVRLPTGGDQDKYGNPYKAILGNGEHWEVKLGGLLAYQPWNCVNFKLDASYSFVIEGTEHRIAAFKGATVKNVGPRADADVDWGYFVGHFDMNFFHPKTKDIRSTIGYEFYYKTEDHLHFKAKSMESWLGGVWDNTAKKFVANPKELSDANARHNTESMSHKVRFETSFQINKYFEMYMGVSTTFAGQNVFRDRDASGGFNLRF
jgi:hypothetical protein